jgi:hypothetical protein
VYIFPLDQEGRIHPKDSGNRRGDVVPAIWLCVEFESERGPVHFHMLFLDGVYGEDLYGKTGFKRSSAPSQQQLAELVHTISHRVAGFLERQGALERDKENGHLNLEEGDEGPMQQVLDCSVSYRIAIGPQQGWKVFTLQTVPALEDDDRFILRQYKDRLSNGLPDQSEKVGEKEPF